MPNRRSASFHSPESRRRYFKELRFRQLRSLCEVARRGSFAKAAEALGLSRPTLWQQVRALEDEFDCRLMTRSGRGVRLTEDGQFMLELVAPIVDGFESIKDAFRQHKHADPLHLTVATTAQLLSNELVRPIQHFRECYPDVHLRFYENTSRLALRMLEENEVDIAIAGLPPDFSFQSGLELEPIWAYPSVLICRPDHPLAKRARLDIDALIKHKLILPGPNTNSRMIFDRIFIRAQVIDRLDVVLETTNAAIFVKFAQMGLGACLVTLSPVFLKQLPSQKSSRGALYWRDISSVLGTERVVLGRRKGKHRAAHVLYFENLVRKEMAGAKHLIETP